MQNTPIIFIHTSNSWYLPYVLYQAEYFNKQRDIILLNDGTISISKPHNFNFTSYNDHPEIVQFKNLYFHKSPNSYKYELLCFLRWFYLREFMREKQLNKAMYLDSDVLLYKDISYLLDLNYTCCFCIPEQEYNSYQWVASGHTSLWALEGIENFCNFLLHAYIVIKNTKIFY